MNSDSMHITAASVLQHKSAAAFSMIGSEGRGRVLIVVEDQNAQGNPNEDERTKTAAIPGRAEPGHNIAGVPIKEI